jgi:hypothetical protein
MQWPFDRFALACLFVSLQEPLLRLVVQKFGARGERCESYSVLRARMVSEYSVGTL